MSKYPEKWRHRVLNDVPRNHVEPILESSDSRKECIIIGFEMVPLQNDPSNNFGSWCGVGKSLGFPLSSLWTTDQTSRQFKLCKELQHSKQTDFECIDRLHNSYWVFRS
ncbi:hypothetical protein NPIL_223481 [Nephila pilipes]|uniref:Uncharacterized protein n=1 Tax=Nephila pilipes TaxID=299642 RepID=A0A8X6JSW3_NEPPI|nr:hypothetical protein NPIL_223481 [Nephila pilipes]